MIKNLRILRKKIVVSEALYMISKRTQILPKITCFKLKVKRITFETEKIVYTYVEKYLR